MVKCYGFESDPSDIRISVDTAERMGMSMGAKVLIEDPDSGNNYAISPQSAELRAELIEEVDNSPGCVRLADELREKAEQARQLNK